jgi:hypothetical protein
MPPRAAPVPQSKNAISKTSLVTLPASPDQIRTVRVREISCLRLLSHTLRGGASRSEILLPLCCVCPASFPLCVSLSFLRLLPLCVLPCYSL